MEEALLAKNGCNKSASSIATRRGGWKASLFIIGVEAAERMSYYSISSSLITYLTNDLHQSTATAAKNVNIWSGVTAILPFLGAFLADVYWGRYWTTLLSSIIYLLVSC